MCEHILPEAQLQLYAAADFAPVPGEERLYLRYDGKNSSVHVQLALHFSKLLNKDVDNPLPVTIKAIRTEPVDEMEQATDNELRVWRLLDPNPNIARFLGAGKLDEWPFDHLSLISQYYSSLDANKFLEVNNIPDDQRLRLLKGILRGILYIHGKSIANILVEDNGEVAKICDFGSSRISCGCYTGPAVQYGTYQWYSPERFETSAPTPESDIWAFGCVVLEIQMDMVPYDDITYTGVVNCMSEEMSPATESYVDPDRPVQRAVWDIVQGCWEHEPLKRPSAAELLLSLEKIGDGPSEILLQQAAPSTNPQLPSPNPSTSQASSYVHSAERYGDARFDQEYSPVGGPSASPFTMSSQTDLHSSRESPHFPLQRVEPPLRYPVSGLSANVESGSGSGSGTSASIDPDRSLKLLGSTKEPHPKNTSASAYSLANILSDSRPSSPVNGLPANPMILDRNPSDDYDDPVTAGIVPPDAVRVLFNFYHETLNPIIALLDPALHTPTYVRARSSVLFTAILCVACRFMRPRAWERCNALGQTLLGRALADGICSIEYVQALSLMTFWKDPRDSSSWRKVGLAIRMAYELNIQAPRERPLAAMEQLAREQLNKERTWLQLVCYDLTTAMQRNKPQMIPDFHLQDSYEWLTNHPEFPCNADAMLVASAALGSVRILCHSLFSSMNASNKGAFEPLMRHVALLVDERVKRWVTDNDQANLAPVSKALLKFGSLNLRLIVAELRLLGLTQPQLTAARTHSLECIKCAMDILRHVIADLAPNRYITYCQDNLAITTAYAGVWLFKQLPYVDDELYQEIVDTFQNVSKACVVLSQQQGDTPSYFVQFFDHLVRNSSGQRLLSVGTSVSPNIPARPDVQQRATTTSHATTATHPVNNLQIPELIPPLEGMDHQWTSVMNGLNDWWKNFNYLGGDMKWNAHPTNPP
ncbi:hypothetical protein FRC06_008480 [Ceratobasidium sp. 370]|nr:hypothetical protein FRC06_008480 [Ceratobasidium sp. 370]